jgi:methylated-DNA-[protein]-cysteine S-methyltransferase
VNAPSRVVRSEHLLEFFISSSALLECPKSEKGMIVYFSRIDTSAVGPLLLAATEAGLRCVQFCQGKLPAPGKDEIWIESRDQLRPYELQLEAYFRGELREFTCKLDLIGTQFQKSCWNALLQIPYGKTCSYADIARSIGRPNAFRAVGQANHDNPIAIIVPCHRVLGANGTLTGYGGGLNTKEKLLRLEGASFRLPEDSLPDRADRKHVAASQATFPY